MLLLLPGVVALPAISFAVSQRSSTELPLEQQLLSFSAVQPGEPGDAAAAVKSSDTLTASLLPPPPPPASEPPAWRSDSASPELLAALPASDRVWMRVRRPVSVSELSSQIGVRSQVLANLNDVGTSHRFQSDEWVVLPSQQSRFAQQVAALDSSNQRRTPPPPTAPPPVQTKGVVRLGDTLLQIAQRYGLTMQELLRFNPGLDTARLVAGTEIQLVQAAPVRQRAVLGLRPSTSGGLSWPDQPDFGEPQQPFDNRGANTWIWPTTGVFTSGYGWRWGRMHRGIDLANNVGTPIKAARNGRVVFSGWHDGGYGYLVTLQHPDGSRSLYAHNSRLMVSSGQEVAQGTVIALMGSTGRSTGPHLHFEIHPPGSSAVNPLNFLPPRA
ncbi:peptidoglycan DD-metalloendopeptidase family protein [Cyanobium sp. CH-040]|uniref:LysM peptidoglycan-binding domain-containing M23 family metallopeptidase n=1 Tax=Cyanobium sp. CH-040 TaxID=2823708 RepID=UPI0020CF1144|nr:peptidoglycan DD-metalloendopeptidase family protein [Cyanobium sp. CH-040]